MITDPLIKIEDATASPIIDMIAIEEIYALDRPEEPRGSFLKELAEVLKETAPDVIEKLKLALQNRDMRAIEHLSHKLKGISRNVTALRLSNLCEIVETESRAGTISSSEVVAAIEAAYLEAASRLDQILMHDPTEKTITLKKNQSDKVDKPQQLSLKQIKILLIEDSPSDAHLVMAALNSPHEGTEFKFTQAFDLATALENVAAQQFDLIFLDLGLPDSFGLETFTTLQTAAANCPVIILSGSLDNRLSAETVENGAQDYVSKNEVSRTILLKTILYALARWQLSTIQKNVLMEEAKRMEKLSRLKSEFLANMSHEIRTPMNGVIGMTSLLQQTALTAEQQEYVSAIKSAGNNLVEIINEILDYSKIEAGKIEIEEVEFSPRQIVEEVMDLFFEYAAAKGLILSSIIDPSIPSRLVGDPTRLRQILSNLVGNGIKFTSSGSVCVQAKCAEANATARSKINFIVSDTGIGIRPEYQSTLFQPFTQEDASITRRFGGTGLGLTICKKLIDLLGGTIQLQSEHGKGTTFTFSIPLTVTDSPLAIQRGNLRGKFAYLSIQDPYFLSALKEQLSLRGLEVWEGHLNNCPAADLVLSDDVAAAEGYLAANITNRPPLVLFLPRAAGISEIPNCTVVRVPYRQSELYSRIAVLIGNEIEAKPTEHLPKPVELSNSRGKILVVEDNKLNQTVAARMLEKLGFSLDIASDGIEALKVIENNQPYSAILMDCSMPEMDGFEVTRRIRAMNTVKANVPIVALTANAFTEDREKCLAVGMNAYLSKPIQIGDLDKALSIYMNGATSKISSSQEAA